ncbi:hypothetical protein CEXT_318801 [Caerostris extrusa]|uniref:Uncharacterized protein n=1 Tax=Caerostris extrusa TaxID=172846 RepID=A0AAV4MFQ6_CAEEX|nr:hypothetical protein CEXT_318801 [Caerostris extrusa]
MHSCRNSSITLTLRSMLHLYLHKTITVQNSISAAELEDPPPSNPQGKRRNTNEIFIRILIAAAAFRNGSKMGNRVGYAMVVFREMKKHHTAAYA